MKLPFWLRVTWWLLITAATTWFLYRRYPELVAGRSVPIDIVVFLVWVALLLAPIFQEITVLGITLKQQIQSLKEDLHTQVASLRADLHNAIDFRANFSPQINFPLPPPDAQLPNLEQVAKEAAAEVLKLHARKEPPPEVRPLQVPEDVQYLFGVRYALEKEISRIARAHDLETFGPRVVGPLQVSRRLVEVGLLTPELELSMRQVYAVCSAAIHGQDVSPAKVEFVRDVAPGLLAALRSIS